MFVESEEVILEDSLQGDFFKSRIENEQYKRKKIWKCNDCYSAFIDPVIKRYKEQTKSIRPLTYHYYCKCAIKKVVDL